MKKISTNNIWALKHLVPLGWFSAISIFLAVGIFQWLNEDYTFTRDPSVIIVPAVMIVMGYFIIKHLIWDMVDEVYDCGDYLLVRNGGKEENIPLADIMNVNSSQGQDPRRITLTLAIPGRFGKEISFITNSSMSFNPFAKDPIAEDLMVRVFNARKF